MPPATPPPTPAPDPAEPTAEERRLLEEVLAVLDARLGRDFRPYRRPTLLRRLRRRVRLAGLERRAAPPGQAAGGSTEALEEYLERLRADGDELRDLAADLTLRVTGFFRDPEAWEALEEPLRALVRSA